MAKKKTTKRSATRKASKKRTPKKKIARKTPRPNSAATEPDSTTRTIKFENPDLDALISALQQIVEETEGNQQPKIKKHYGRGDLVLALGAGVSLDHGLPDWNTLLQRLLLSTIATNNDDTSSKAPLLAKIFARVFSPDPLIAARYLSLHFQSKSKQDPLAFVKAIREALYEDESTTRDSELMSEIVKFCIAAGKTPNLDSIITYNYDNIVEQHLDQLDLGVPYSSIFHQGMHAKKNALPIYHVHGFLPPQGKLTDKNKLVLSEELYHEQYTDVYHWSNLVQLTKFREKNCLFIGSSFTDPNLRRLLDIANKMRGENTISHYMFKRKYNENNVRQSLSELAKDPKYNFDSNDKKALRDKKTVKELISIMANHESSDAKSFGVGIIWIDGWDEVPKYLREIRESAN